MYSNEDQTRWLLAPFLHRGNEVGEYENKYLSQPLAITITQVACVGGGSNEDALSEIVGFVLILALVVVASTLYLMYVVPAEGREDEIEHMNKVQDRFVSYKTSVDGLWMRSLADLSIPGTRGVSLSTSFDLGTGGGNTQSSGLFLSFMRPIGTAARMQTKLGIPADDPNDDRIGLQINNENLFPELDPAGEDAYYEMPVGSLSYHTDNYYWIQQNYYYKLGGIFLEQPGEGVSVKVAPPIAIYQVTDASTGQQVPKVSISLVNINSDPSTVGGTGPLRIETRLRESGKPLYRNEKVDSVFLWVYAKDHEWAEAWRQVFFDAAWKSGLAGPDDVLDDPTTYHDWFYIPKLPNDEAHLEYNIAKLYVRHYPLDETIKDVFLDLTEANLQVTFEYDE